MHTNYMTNFDELFNQEVKNLEQRQQEEVKHQKFYNTLIEEKMETIEGKLIKEHERMLSEQAFREVTELKNKSNLFDTKKAQLDVLRGQFHLRLNRKLPFVRKIEKYANEPVAFYLHKKRDFLQRIDQMEHNMDRKDEREFQQLMKSVLETEDIKRTIEDMELLNEKGKRINQSQENLNTEDIKKQKRNSQLKQNLKQMQEKKRQFELEQKQQEEEKNQLQKQSKKYKSYMNRTIDSSGLNPELKRIVKSKYEEIQSKISKETRQSFSLNNRQVDDSYLFPKTQLIDLALKKVKIDQSKQLEKRQEYQNKAKELTRFKTSNHTQNQVSKDILIEMQKTQKNKFIDLPFDFQDSPKQNVRVKTQMGMSRNCQSQMNRTSISQYNQSTIPTKMHKNQMFQEKLLLNHAIDRFQSLKKQNKQSPIRSQTAFNIYKTRSEFPNLSQTRPLVTFKPDLQQNVIQKTQNIREVEILDKQKQKQLEQIMKTCFIENKSTHDSLQYLNTTFQDFKEKDKRFNTVSDTLKELENVDISVLQQIYEYKINEKDEEVNESKAIVKDYKMNYLDPSKYIVKLTKSSAWKNAAKMKKAISVKFKS
eukprot:403356589